MVSVALMTPCIIEINYFKFYGKLQRKQSKLGCKIKTYLNKDVLADLRAVVVNTDVTGESFSQKYVSEKTTTQIIVDNLK